jgi:hypothetical protein
MEIPRWKDIPSPHSSPRSAGEDAPLANSRNFSHLACIIAVGELTYPHRGDIKLPADLIPCCLGAGVLMVRMQFASSSDSS